MTAVIMNGKEVAMNIRKVLAEEIAATGVSPLLAIVQVGDNPASQIYVRNKHKAAAEIGMKCRICYVPETDDEENLRNLLLDLNDNDDVNGIIVQLPLPQNFDDIVFD